MRRHKSVKTFQLPAASHIPKSSRSYCGREAPELLEPAGNCSQLHIRLGAGWSQGPPEVSQSDALGVCIQRTQDNNANECLDQTRRYFGGRNILQSQELLQLLGSPVALEYHHPFDGTS